MAAKVDNPKQAFVSAVEADGDAIISQPPLVGFELHYLVDDLT
jgi:hypothetical protein